MTTQLRILSLGWGIQSWTLAAMSALGELPPVDYAVHSDTTFERAATYAFAAEWTPWLEAHGIKVVTVSDPAAANITKKSGTSDGTYTLMPVFTLEPARLTEIFYRTDADGREIDEPDEGDFGGDTEAYSIAYAEWEKLDGHTRTIALPARRGQLRRQCTSRWKIEPLQKWLGGELKRRGLDRTPGIVQQQLGITMDEWQRAKDSQVAWIENSYPLLDRRMTRKDCLDWLQAHDLPSPGKSACVQCMFHSRAYWQEMKAENGDDWRRAVAADDQLRATTGRAWYLHSDRKPLIEAVILKSESPQAWMFDEDNEPECDSGHCFL